MVYFISKFIELPLILMVATICWVHSIGFASLHSYITIHLVTSKQSPSDIHKIIDYATPL